MKSRHSYPMESSFVHERSGLPVRQERPHLSLALSRMQQPSRPMEPLSRAIEQLIQELEEALKIEQVLTSRFRGFEVPAHPSGSMEGPSFSLDGYDHRVPGSTAWDAWDDAERDSGVIWENIESDYLARLQDMVRRFHERVPQLVKWALENLRVDVSHLRLNASRAVHMVHSVLGDRRTMYEHRLHVQGTLKQRYQLPPGRDTIGPLRKGKLEAFLKTVPLILRQSQPYHADFPSFWRMLEQLEREKFSDAEGSLSALLKGQGAPMTALYAHALLTMVGELVFLWNHLVQPRSLLKMSDVLSVLFQEEGLDWPYMADEDEDEDDDDAPTSSQSLRTPAPKQHAYVYPTTGNDEPARLGVSKRMLSAVGQLASRYGASETTCTCGKGRKS
ncbi:MAG: hypothetical protein ACKO6N_21165 [Myxococcota bacterium]